MDTTYRETKIQTKSKPNKQLLKGRSSDPLQNNNPLFSLTILTLTELKLKTNRPNS